MTPRLSPADRASSLSRWMLAAALPLWWAGAADLERGGWRDHIAQDGSLPELNRRCRVQARQTYVYALAGKMDWDGPWRRASRHGLDYLRTRHRRPDGLFRTKVRPDGSPADDSALLYDQAFVLFALAAFARAAPEESGLEAEALSLLAAVRAGFTHPRGGFREADPTSPFQSNPHMHLFEAAMEWEGLSGDPAWPKLADSLAELCLTRFIDQESGALREFFDADWRPAPGLPGRAVWPGHQFEWAWLLDRWGERRGRADARKAARRLHAVGADHGVDRTRNVAINGLLDDFSVHDPVARLWPQTERIKSAVRLAASASDPADREALLSEASAAVDGLELYLQTRIPGLWYDRLDADGRMIEEPAPTSSFYHIACAIAELSGRPGALSGQDRAAADLGRRLGIRVTAGATGGWLPPSASTCPRK